MISFSFTDKFNGEFYVFWQDGNLLFQLHYIKYSIYLTRYLTLILKDRLKEYTLKLIGEYQATFRHENPTPGRNIHNSPNFREMP